MSRLSRMASRLLLLVSTLLPILSVPRGAWGVASPESPSHLLLAASPVPPQATLTPAPPLRDRRIVQPPAGMDQNHDRVDDRLQALYRRDGRAGLQVPGAPPSVDILLGLDHAPTPEDLARYRAMGTTALESWGDLVYAIRARFPATALPPAALDQLGRGPGVTWVEENAVHRSTAYFAMRQARVRPLWAAGFQGDPTQAIVILDSGIDATHPDFAGRVIAWRDFAGVNAAVTGDEYALPSDLAGHGTAVAGLAAGDGTTAGIASGSGPLNLSITAPLFTSLGGGFFPLDTRAATGASTLTTQIKWQGTPAGVTHQFQLLSDALSGATVLANGSSPATGPQPFTLRTDTIPSGRFSFFYRAIAGTSANATGTPFPAWMQISTPMSAVGDGFPLMRGAAPGCKIVAVKTADDAGMGDDSLALNAMAWINANRQALRIVCVNNSSGSNAVNATVDTAVNQLVQNGIVWVNSAGNSREVERELEAARQSSGIFSPNSASKAITVGATDDVDRVTYYSSYGRVGQRKPDVVAPGGSDLGGRLLVSVDPNGFDPLGTGAGKVPDQFPNDYALVGMGTSLSSPIVAGAVMLVAQAVGPWNFTEAQALRVKMLLLMTASETAVKAEPVSRDPLGQSLPLPPDTELNRGEKDRVEGFGRINPDAAVEAATQALTVGTAVTTALGPVATDKKVWARNVALSSGRAFALALTNPPGADYDLYLYADTPVSVGGSDGEPRIVASSTRAGLGGTELLAFTPTTSGTYYVVVKHVAGSGAFQLASATGADFVIGVSPGTQALAVKGERVRYTVTAYGLNGYTDPIDLSLATPPAGTQEQFVPPTITPGQTSVLTLTTSTSTPDGALNLSIQGTSRGVAKIAPARLETGALWPRFRHDARGLSRSPLTGPQDYKPLWSTGFNLASYSSPAVGADGTIYYGTRGSGSNPGRLVATRPTDGRVLWTFLTPNGQNVDSAPAIGVDGTIYFGADDGQLYAVDTNGSLKWQLALGGGPVRSAPVIAPDGTIYVTAGGSLFAVQWNGTRKWIFATGSSESSSPSLASDGTLYFGAGPQLFAVLDNGGAATEKWRFATTGSVLSSPLVAPNGSIYFGSLGDSAGGRFYVVTDNGANATKVTEYTPSGAVRSAPAIGPSGSVYVGSDDSRVYAFQPNGTFKWRFDVGGQVVGAPAVGGDGMLYVGTRTRSLYGLRDQDTAGQFVWGVLFTTGELQGSPAIGAGGTLYVSPTGGGLHAFSAP